jgi:S-adenosylmethionine hydrolase
VLRWLVTQNSVITLTTDFGLSDAYVAVMKGVILGIAPQSTIVDISHQIQPQNVGEASYLLCSAYQYFPSDAVHVAVVDPGVGTKRKAIAVQAHHGMYVGPDNGIFSPVLMEQQVIDERTGEMMAGSGVELTNDQYWRKPVSQTFHGRDIFAPVAAHLTLGTPLERFGHLLSSLVVSRNNRVVLRGSTIYGCIVHIDRFGNAISNVGTDVLPANPVIEVGGRVIKGLASSYQDARVVAVIGSSGLLEVAARNGSAAVTLGLRTGDPIVIRPAT